MFLAYESELGDITKLEKQQSWSEERYVRLVASVPAAAVDVDYLLVHLFGSVDDLQICTIYSVGT